MKAHPAAALFPLLGEAELGELAADIKANGLRVPIVTHVGQVLDGRNRLRACELAGVEPRFENFAGADPVAFVVSLNIKRRHLDESQRAMVGARLLPMLGEEARKRQGARTDLRDIPPDLGGSRGEAAEHAARLVNVGRGTVEAAARVLKRAEPELVEAVDRGDVAVSAAAAVADLPAKDQRAVVHMIATGEARHVKDALRQLNHEAKRIVTLDEAAQGRYAVVYADPPWSYNNSGFDGSPEDHYPTMPTDAICALPVGSKLTTNAVCFLWATNPLLEDALRVMAAWGFSYKTNLVWVKDRGTYLGFYANGFHELLLIGTRGAMVPDRSTIPKSVIEAPRTEHSRKPPLHAVIERMYPDGPYLELFARRPAGERWTVFGNEGLDAGG